MASLSRTEADCEVKSPGVVLHSAKEVGHIE